MSRTSIPDALIDPSKLGDSGSGFKQISITIDQIDVDRGFIILIDQQYREKELPIRGKLGDVINIPVML